MQIFRIINSCYIKLFVLLLLFVQTPTDNIVCKTNIFNSYAYFLPYMAMLYLLYIILQDMEINLSNKK